jgi:hypothetical protein
MNHGASPLPSTISATNNNKSFKKGHVVQKSEEGRKAAPSRDVARRVGALFGETSTLAHVRM